MTDRILYVIDVPGWDDNRIGDTLRARGFAVEACCHAAGDPLPRRLDGYAGVVLGGGVHSIADGHPHLEREMALVRDAVERDIALLGICLGAQLVGGAFGATVGEMPDGRGEYGFYRLEETAAGRGFLGAMSHAYQIHRECCLTLPEGAVHLARSAAFEHQAFALGERVLAVQLHPDVRPDMVKEIVQQEADQLARPGARPAATHMPEALRHEAAIQAWTEATLDRLFGPPLRATA